MTPRTPAEHLIADILAKALSGDLTVGPLDLMRLTAAAREVESSRVAPLALARWLLQDPRARVVIQAAVEHSKGLFNAPHPRARGRR